MEILADDEYYACSMCPQVLEKQMGLCPICAMPLAKITLDKDQIQIIKLNAEQKKLANVKVDTASMSSIGEETILAGKFVIDQNKTEQISARIPGRIEKLYHKIIGEQIIAGEPAYDLYSRELMLAQEEYLFAVEKGEIIGGEHAISASKNKLLLWGLSESQISELGKSKQSKITTTIFSSVSGTITEIPVKEGDIAIEGSKIYQVADLNSLWAEAQIYSNELGLLRQDVMVEIIPDGYPEETTEGTISFSNPGLESGSIINLVRSEVKNPNGKFRPGMRVTMILHSEVNESIVLPVDAVIRDSQKAVVWVQNNEGGFESRAVETGIESKFGIEITSGVRAGEVVVVSGAYLINSEYIFKLGMVPGAETGDKPKEAEMSGPVYAKDRVVNVDNRFEETTEEPAEVVEEPVNNVSDKSVDAGYHLIGGAFADKVNADKYVSDMTAKGYPAQILGLVGGLHQVSINSFDSYNAAAAAMARLENDKVWIRKVR